MNTNILAKLFEHNRWANRQIINACAELPDEQLDAQPQTATKGTIRETLWHLVGAEHGYLSQLLGTHMSENWQRPSNFEELQQSAERSATGLIALAEDPANRSLHNIIYKDNYAIEPWVLMVQAINHATEHREQIKSILSELGITPPRIDGWSYGWHAKGFSETEP